jgi:hypothetical protein
MVIRTAFSTRVSKTRPALSKVASGFRSWSLYLHPCPLVAKRKRLTEVFLSTVKHSHALFNACFSSSRSVISRKIEACNLNRLSSAGVLPSK